MISKNRIKEVLSLQRKKERDESEIYVIEGDKIVREYLKAGQKLKLLAAKPEFISSLKSDEKVLISEIEPCSYEELKKMSSLTTPHNALALVPYPEKSPYPGDIFNGLILALEYVQDPGNLGTIIRSAAWFGIRNMICSPDCVDLYNPKVIQASMGSILNVSVHYMPLSDFLGSAAALDIPVFGAVLDGIPVYDHPLDKRGVILLGNESRGISAGLVPLITHKIMIPKISRYEFGIESLNVSMAASVIISEFIRRK